MEFRVYDIKWDTETSCKTDEEEIQLPTEMSLSILPAIFEDAETEEERQDTIEDYISDQISNRSGFCHYGFKCEQVEEKDNTKTWAVPFQAEETVWNDYVAYIEAPNKMEAFTKLQKLIEEGENPFCQDFITSEVGVNTVTADVVETNKYYIEKEHNSIVENIREHYDLPFANDLTPIQQAMTASKKTVLEIDKNSIDQDVYNKFLALNKTGKDCIAIQSIVDLIKSLNSGNANKKWVQFVNYCVEQCVDYIIVR